MNINDMYPSKYLKASDLQGREARVSISHIIDEQVGQTADDRKPVLYFQGKQKGLALNKTNAGIIAHYYGPETDGWAGKPVILYEAMVPFNNQMTPAIRVRIEGGQPSAPPVQPPVHSTGTQPAPPAAPPAVEAPQNFERDLDDEIPF